MKYMSTGRVIRDRREAMNMDQVDLAQAVGVSDRQIKRYEAGEQGPTLAVANNLARVLHLSLDELAGNRPMGLDVSGEWHARWDTTRRGEKQIDKHPIRAGYATEYVTFVAGGDYSWRGDFRIIEESLVGSYYSTDSGRRSRGAMYLLLSPHGDAAVGRWDGLSVDGALCYGWGAIARTEDHADRLIEWLVKHDLPLIGYPQDLL